jgi:AlwI restriction endonuclease
MVKSSWSFPTSPRNPAKIPFELKILAPLSIEWKQQGRIWSPQTTQIEFGKALRDFEADEDEEDLEGSLVFQKQADEISESNLAWTARARFGTFKFLGFVNIIENGYAELTEAGQRMANTKRPDLVMLKQLIKWQYPDNQHKGTQYPETIFHIWPFVAVAQLIKELRGLTKNELALFCFVMTTMSDVNKTRKAITNFRDDYANAKGKIPKQRLIATMRHSLKQRFEDQGISLPVSSFHDYADSLARYMRFTGLFSISGSRITLTKGREDEVEEILKLKRELYPYKDRDKFYHYYGNPDVPVLSTDHNPTILQKQIQGITAELPTLYAELGVLQQGMPLESPVSLLQPLPIDIEELRTLLDDLREKKKQVELGIMDIRGRGPEKLMEALNFYDDILNRQTFDAPTYLEWNTWRVFVALDRAKKIKPNLVMDENLAPVGTAGGNGPDMEVSFPNFHIVPEVTMRTGADQERYESFPVIRHVEDFIRKVAYEETYGLFIAPRIHRDTVVKFFMAWKQGGFYGESVKIVPLTVAQFREVVRSYSTRRDFQPAELLRLFEQIGETLQGAKSPQKWQDDIPTTIEKWKQWLQDSTS